jgi:hypothetical protein
MSFPIDMILMAAWLCGCFALSWFFFEMAGNSPSPARGLIGIALGFIMVIAALLGVLVIALHANGLSLIQ